MAWPGNNVSLLLLLIRFLNDGYFLLRMTLKERLRLAERFEGRTTCYGIALFLAGVTPTIENPNEERTRRLIERLEITTTAREGDIIAIKEGEFLDHLGVVVEDNARKMADWAGFLDFYGHLRSRIPYREFIGDRALSRQEIVVYRVN